MGEPVPRGWVYRRIMLPVLGLLRMGATPEKLAWSLAVGLLIGINPMLGTTTLLCLAVAFVLRLHMAASQLGNYLMYPLQLVMVIPFIRLGSWAFRTEAMPLSAPALLLAARVNPVALTRRLWVWECHALVVWAAVAIVATPLLAMGIAALLRRLLPRVERHEFPILQGGINRQLDE